MCSLVDMYFSSAVLLFLRAASIYKVQTIGILYYVLEPSPTRDRGREARHVSFKTQCLMKTMKGIADDIGTEAVLWTMCDVRFVLLKNQWEY